LRTSLRFLFALLAVGILAILLLSLVAGYTSSLRFLLSYFHLGKYADRAFKLVTPSHFHLLQVLLLLFGLVLVYLIFNAGRIEGYLRRFLNSFVFRFRQTTNLYFILFVILSLGIAVYFSLVMPVSFDEAFTYMNFSSRGLVASMTYYPKPNNHILHSLLTNLSLTLPFAPLFLMRLPTLFVNLLLLFVTYHFLSEQFSEKFALFTCSINALFFYSIFYSYESRGYELFALFFVLSVYCSFKIVSAPSSRYYWICLVVSFILGFYTMPCFLYPCLSLNMFILLGRRRLTLYQVVSNLVAGCVVALLYAPIVIVNGLGALVANEYVKPLSRAVVLSRLPGYFYSFLTEMSGWPAVVVIVFLAAGLLYLCLGPVANMKKYYNAPNMSNIRKLFFVVMLLSLPVFLLVHSVIPFPRTLYYYDILICVLCLSPFSAFIEKASFPVLFGLILSFAIVMCIRFNSLVRPYERDAFEAREMANKIADGNSFLVSSGLFDVYLGYYMKTRYKKSVEMICFPVPGVNADTLAPNRFDYVVVDKVKDFTKIRKPLLSNDYVRVY